MPKFTLYEGGETVLQVSRFEKWDRAASFLASGNFPSDKEFYVYFSRHRRDLPVPIRPVDQFSILLRILEEQKRKELSKRPTRVTFCLAKDQEFGELARERIRRHSIVGGLTSN